MNLINEMPYTIPNLGVIHHEPDENPSWSNLTVLTIATLVSAVVYVLFQKYLSKKTQDNFSQRKIPPPIIKAPQTMPLTPTWVKELKEKGAKEVCSWVFPRETVSIFQVEDQFIYTLTYSFQQKHSSSIWNEDSQQFSLKTDGTLPIEERISRLQKRVPVIQNRKVMKFVRVEERGDDPVFKQVFLIDEKPIRWVNFYLVREPSDFTILSDWSSDDFDSFEREPFSLKHYTILNSHDQNCKLIQTGEGIFDYDLHYAADYSEFASDEYYASDEGKEILRQLLPEMCELYENNFDGIKNILVRFQQAIQQARSNEDRCTAFEEYIPFQIRLSWLTDFKKKLKVNSQLDSNTTLDRDNWAATLIDTGTSDSSNPITRLGHAVLVIEGIRQGSPFMWRTDLRMSGIKPPKKISHIPIKRHTRTWQVNQQDSKTRKGVMSVVKQILEEKRTGVVRWGYVFGTHNCSTWAIGKLNEMLEPIDRIRVYPSIAEALLYHKAAQPHNLSQE